MFGLAFPFKGLHHCVANLVWVSVFFVCMYIQFFKKLYVRRSEEKVHTYKFLEILTKIMLESALRKKKISKVYLKVSKFSACGGQSTFTMNKFIDPGYRGPKWCNILKISKKLYVLQKTNKKTLIRHVRLVGFTPNIQI